MMVVVMTALGAIAYCGSGILYYTDCDRHYWFCIYILCLNAVIHAAYIFCVDRTHWDRATRGSASRALHRAGLFICYTNIQCLVHIVHYIYCMLARSAIAAIAID